MNKNLTSDALNLVKNILGSIVSDKCGVIVNIARDERDSFLIEGIGTVYGYKQDRTPDFLEKYGAIMAKNEGKWFEKFVDPNDEWVTKVLPRLNFVDSIFITALDNDFWEDDEIPKYYYEATNWTGTTDVYSWGPKKDRHASVLINVDVLKKFRDEFQVQNKQDSILQDNMLVIFDEDTGEIKISGNVVEKIRKNTDEFELCKVILKNESSKKRLWDWDIMLDKWKMGNLPNLKDKKMKVYRAARSVNMKIARSSTYKDFFLYNTNTVQLNPTFK